MSKVNFKDLPKGMPLRPSMVWDSLLSVRTSLEGAVSSDQRKHARSLFSVPLYAGRIEKSVSTFNPSFTFKVPPVVGVSQHNRINTSLTNDTP